MTRDELDPRDVSTDGMHSGIGPGIVLSIVFAILIFGLLLLSHRG